MREVHEESGLLLDEGSLQQIHIFSNPKRDPRRAGASVLMTVLLDRQVNKNLI